MNDVSPEAADATPIKQVIYGDCDGRVYRCTICGKESPLLENGEELAAWMSSHECEGE